MTTQKIERVRFKNEHFEVYRRFRIAIPQKIKFTKDGGENQVFSAPTDEPSEGDMRDKWKERGIARLGRRLPRVSEKFRKLEDWKYTLREEGNGKK
jgi:hypothetical protein